MWNTCPFGCKWRPRTPLFWHRGWLAGYSCTCACGCVTRQAEPAREQRRPQTVSPSPGIFRSGPAQQLVTLISPPTSPKTKILAPPLCSITHAIVPSCGRLFRHTRAGCATLRVPVDSATPRGPVGPGSNLPAPVRTTSSARITLRVPEEPLGPVGAVACRGTAVAFCSRGCRIAAPVHGAARRARFHHSAPPLLRPHWRWPCPRFVRGSASPR